MKRSAFLLVMLCASVAAAQEVDLLGVDFAKRDSHSMDILAKPPGAPPQVPQEDMQLDLFGKQPQATTAKVGRGDRVLLFVDLSESVTRSQVCTNGDCRWVENRVPRHAASAKVVAELKAVPTEGNSKWAVASDATAHFQIVDVSDAKNAALVQKYKPQELPQAVKLAGHSETARIVADKGPIELCKWWLNPTTAAATSHIARQWSFPGDIRQHLTDPSQPHGLSPDLIRGWTDEQCIDWHNRHHELMESRQSAPARRSIGSEISDIARQVLGEEVSAIRGKNPLSEISTGFDPG